MTRLISGPASGAAEDTHQKRGEERAVGRRTTTGRLEGILPHWRYGRIQTTGVNVLGKAKKDRTGQEGVCVSDKEKRANATSARGVGWGCSSQLQPVSISGKLRFMLND